MRKTREKVIAKRQPPRIWTGGREIGMIGFWSAPA
jgi:hypothetical protein